MRTIFQVHEDLRKKYRGDDYDIINAFLKEIVQEHGQAMLHTASRILPSSDLAAEVFQDTLLHIGRYTGIQEHILKLDKEEKSCRGYLLVIVTGRARTLLKKETRHQHTDIQAVAEIASTNPSVEAELESKEMLDAVLFYLQNNDNINLRALKLFRQYYTIAQISESEGISESNAKQRIARARQEVKAWLRENGYL